MLSIARNEARTASIPAALPGWVNLPPEYAIPERPPNQSEDLGDETGDPASSLQLLNQWQAELDACYAGVPRHPVFVALAETVRKFEIPKQTFVDLLTAFRQDQTVTRYPTFGDLLGYCRYSANPVGRLVLYVCGYRDAERQALSDFTCTALQLANF
jgi:phytoene/squalene synthetase